MKNVAVETKTTLNKSMDNDIAQSAPNKSINGKQTDRQPMTKTMSGRPSEDEVYSDYSKQGSTNYTPSMD